MEKNEIEKYKELLLEEKQKLQKDLESRGRDIVKGDDADWIAVPNKDDDEVSGSADSNENADDIDDFETNIGIVRELEQQYNEVERALERIENGKFGVCEGCDKQIGKDRLDALPTATTCKECIK